MDHVRNGGSHRKEDTIQTSSSPFLVLEGHGFVRIPWVSFSFNFFGSRVVVICQYSCSGGDRKVNSTVPKVKAQM